MIVLKNIFEKGYNLQMGRLLFCADGKSVIV